MTLSPSVKKPQPPHKEMTTLSQTEPQKEACADAPRAVKLSERIRYIHCEGGEDRDSHGVMTFVDKNDVPLFVKEVANQDDFKLNYSVFRMMEDLA